VSLSSDLFGPSVLCVPPAQPSVRVARVDVLLVHPGHGRDGLVVSLDDHLYGVGRASVEEVDVARQRHRDKLVAGASVPEAGELLVGYVGTDLVGLDGLSGLEVPDLK
jgi:hypothetical protein